MTTIKHISVPNTGFGILHPLIKYRYRVNFVNASGEQLPYSDAIARQLVRISSYEQSRQNELAKFGLASENDRLNISFEVEEDVTCTASDALQQLFNADAFAFIIEYLDGNETVLKTATFYDCQVNSLIHGELDYAGCPSSKTYARMKVPLREGKLIDELNDNAAARAVLAVLNGAEFTVEGQSNGSGVVTTVVSVTYGSVEINSCSSTSSSSSSS